MPAGLVSDPSFDRLDPETAAGWRAASPQAGYALSTESALAYFASQDSGLTNAEAAQRRAEVGANELPRPRRAGLLRLYARQFRNPLVYLLLGATLVSIGVGELADAAFIFVVLQFNAVIGTLQEWKAAANAEALNRLIKNVAVVWRDGQKLKRDAADLVPGDILQLESGSRVAADLRLLSAQDLGLDESLLTGESTPVTKDANAILPAGAGLGERTNMLHAGTTVLSGRARGLVTATGLRTEVGKIAEALIQNAPVPPPLVRRLERFSRVIGVATLVLIGLLAVPLLLQGVPLVTVFLVAVALAVAAIPEGLPIAITVALAIASNRMERRKVIVRDLPAVEGLGACTLIASDKTGTLTCNELTVKRIYLPEHDGSAAEIDVGGEGYDRQGHLQHAHGGALTAPDETRLRRLALSAALCNEASLRFTETGVEHLGDTVDVAFLLLAAKLGLDLRQLRQDHPETAAIPYEPERRFAASFTTELQGGPGSDVSAHVKGAAEVVLPLCRAIDREALLAEVDRLAAEGYRVLAVAQGRIGAGATRSPTREDLAGLEFLGLVGLIDPIRPEVPAAVAQCREAGIAVRMVTGDHPATALSIARSLDIAENRAEVVTGNDLAAAREDPEGFTEMVTRARVFARVEPVQKLDIVQALRSGGHVVAVTGDGVNDAPALAAGDIGVAMGLNGTDVARDAADLILADDNFASIVGGVEEGRIAYDNVRKLIFLLIATGLGEIVLFLCAIFFGIPLPLFAVQLLWLNLVTNGIQDVALAFECGEPGVLKRSPRPPTQRLFDKAMVRQVFISGIYMGLMAFLFFEWCLQQGMDTEVARNRLLLLMVLFENAHALNARSERRSVLRVPFAANRFLIFAIVGAQVLHISAMYIPGLREILGLQPISLLDWTIIAVIASSLILVMEAYKRFLVPNSEP